MSTALHERPAPAGARNGGVPARRAVVRWAWRMFRREWRQQLLVLALIVVAVAATFIGAAVATDTPPKAGAGFGTASDAASFQSPDPHLAAQLAALEHRFGRVDVIENQTVAIPGSINTYDLRAQNPRGPFGQPMLTLVSGHYPAGPGEVAVTDGVASAFKLKIGDVWHQDGTARRVVGIVQNPQSLLDEFALVSPGQVRAPTQVTVLFDARGPIPASLSSNVESRTQAAQSNPINPETIMLALVTVAMLLIALMAAGGFTVLAQRRLRSLGMLASLGATDKHIRLVVRANGVVVGICGALIGAALGLAGWLAYRPRLEASAHHVIGVFQLPWLVIAVAMVLAVAGYVLRRLPPGPLDHQGPHRDRPVRTSRAAQAGTPVRGPRRGLPRNRRAPAVLRRYEHQWRRRRGARTGLRSRRPRRGGAPAVAAVPGPAGQVGPACAGSGAAGPARPGPVPGQLGFGAGGYQYRRADRGTRLRLVGAAVRERPRLRRAQRGLESDHRLHAQQRSRGAAAPAARPPRPAPGPRWRR